MGFNPELKAELEKAGLYDNPERRHVEYQIDANGIERTISAYLETHPAIISVDIESAFPRIGSTGMSRILVALNNSKNFSSRKLGEALKSAFNADCYSVRLVNGHNKGPRANTNVYYKSEEDMHNYLRSRFRETGRELIFTEKSLMPASIESP